MFLCIVEDALFVAFVLHKEHQLDGLEGHVDDIADAEDKDKGAGSGYVSECPEAEECTVEEETAHS